MMEADGRGRLGTNAPKFKAMGNRAMPSESNKPPAALATAVTVAFGVGWLHVVGWVILMIFALAGGSVSVADFPAFIPITCVIVLPGSLYLGFAMRMAQRGRRATIATLVLAGLEAGALLLIALALWFGAQSILGGLIVLGCLAFIGALILYSAEALRHWDNGQQPGGFAVLMPPAPPAATPPADAESDRRTEP